MRKFLALIALVLPLIAAPVAFAASDPDATFYKKAAEGGIFEVDAGNQAQQKSNNQQVKDFGAMLVSDHTKANDELKSLAASKDVSLPTTASVSQMAEKAKLDLLSGDTYDKSFILGQIKAHEQTIALFRKEAATGRDAEARSFAKETLPVLRKHLRTAREIAAKEGYTGSK